VAGLGVVADQIGAPTSAFDISEGILAIARNLLAGNGVQSLAGLLHMGAGGPDVSWAGFERASARGGKVTIIDRLPTSAYPTLAKRPAQSRLASKLAKVHGVQLPDWRAYWRPS
jgi:dTDP-4-dehydrorhamnose reductase